MSKRTIVQWLTCGLLITALFIIALIYTRSGIKLGLLFSVAPLLLIVFTAIITNPYWGLMALFVINYFIMGISRYVSASSLGIATDAIIVLTIASFIYRTAFVGDLPFKRIKKNLLIILLLLWMSFCIIEVLNPTAVYAAWLSNIRPYAIYPFFTVLFTTILFNKFKDLKAILTLWSVFTFLAFVKVIMQQYIGFDSGETNWLNQGGARTHLLITGIRYFSFFTDAGNFGSNMGCSMVVFTLAAFFVKNDFLKFWYFFIGLCGAYGMFVSGTRGAMAVPFAGYVLYVLLSKNFKSMTFVSVFIAILYVFLNFTYIGQGNQYIRRMRTAFDENDASYQVRKDNQKTLAIYMKSKPFGEGLGLSGAEAERYTPGRITTLPNDSWYVKVWVETGIVGVSFHIILLAISLLYGSYLILVRIKNRELRGMLTAMICGFAGILASSYGNAIFLQYPTGIIMYMIQAFLFLGPEYDKELESSNQITENGV
jgi:hypothetical protein